MAVDKLIRAGVAASKAGDKVTAAVLFSRVVQEDPRSVDGWLWLGKSVSQSDEQIYCFRRVLKLDPAHLEARLQLERLGYLKSEVPPPFSKSVPASVSPFSVDPADGFVQKSVGDSVEEKKPLPSAPSLPEWSEEKEFGEEAEEKKEEGKKKGSRVLIAVFGVLALFSLGGMAALFFLQPNLLAIIENGSKRKHIEILMNELVAIETILLAPSVDASSMIMALSETKT